MVPSEYDDELLLLAHDMANRLLAAFELSATQIPYPRVSEARFWSLVPVWLPDLLGCKFKLSQRGSGL